MRHIVLFLTIFIPGLTGTIVFGYYILIDWSELQLAYESFTQTAQASSEFEALFLAEAQQNIHRINLFADGVWTLLSAILTALGLLGLCIVPRRRRS